VTHRLILARHGQTVSNRDGLIMGRSDSPLTEEGLNAAEEVARMLAAEAIATVFVSPLGRAVTSARIYTRGLHELQIRDAMAELSCGQWEGRVRREVTLPGKVLRQTWDFRPPGGESYLDGEARVRPFVEELRTRTGDGIVLVVAHASVNRVFLKLWLELETGHAERIVSPHDTVYLLDGERPVQAWSATGELTNGLILEALTV
jgi:broad specificity phosphatase PhoE